MALNTIVKETGIESAIAFGIGTFVNSFISDHEVNTDNWTRSLIEVIGGLIANGMATNAYVDFARSRGDPELMKMVPFLITLGAVQPKLIAKINGLSSLTSTKWKGMISAVPGTPVAQDSPAANANQTRKVMVKPSMWVRT